MQVRAAYVASIRIIRGGKKKTHSPAFVKFETFVFKKLRDACAPWKGSLHLAQGRAKRRPGYCRPSPVSALKGQKRKNPGKASILSLHHIKYAFAEIFRAKLVREMAI